MTTTFNRYLIDDELAAGELRTKKAELFENRGLSDFEGFAAGMLGRRMLNHPEQYIEFGPYWWALKEALARRGHDFGSDAAPALAAAYKGNSDGETFIKAEIFKDLYRQNWAVGTNVFDLSLSGESPYELIDSDMQDRIP